MCARHSLLTVTSKHPPFSHLRVPILSHVHAQRWVLTGSFPSCLADSSVYPFSFACSCSLRHELAPSETSWSSRERHTSRQSTVLTFHCNLGVSCDSLLLPSLTGSTGVGRASLFQRPLPVVTVFCRCHDYISRGRHGTGLNYQTLQLGLDWLLLVTLQQSFGISIRHIGSWLFKTRQQDVKFASKSFGLCGHLGVPGNPGNLTTGIYEMQLSLVLVFLCLLPFLCYWTGC